jgi:hypothetical protein
VKHVHIPPLLQYACIKRIQSLISTLTKFQPSDASHIMQVHLCNCTPNQYSNFVSVDYHLCLRSHQLSFKAERVLWTKAHHVFKCPISLLNCEHRCFVTSGKNITIMTFYFLWSLISNPCRIHINFHIHEIESILLQQLKLNSCLFVDFYHT